MIARIGAFAWLLLVWVVLMESVTPGSVLAGVLVCAAIVAVFRYDVSSADPIRVRPLQVVRLVAYFTVKLVQANVQVARAVVDPRSQATHGIVAVPVAASDTLLTLLANAVSLTPGTSIVEVRTEPSTTLYVHVLQLESVEATQREILALELRLMRALGSAASIARVHELIADVGQAPPPPAAPAPGEVQP
jgi:multicomponent Na+:H+ antiporter subunit E